MRFDPWKCPKCGEPADGTVETMAGKAILNFDENGNAEYSGDTKVWWDEQQTETDEDGHPTLICENGHEWNAQLTEEDE